MAEPAQRTTKPQSTPTPILGRAREPTAQRQTLNDQRADGGGTFLDDRRMASVGGTGSGDPPIQRVTKVRYGTPLNFNYDNPAAIGNNGLASAVPLGQAVEAELDLLDPQQGTGVGGGAALTAARADTAAKHGGPTWVLGHLLNDDLGGLGIGANLYPITQQANMEHYYSVERKIKGLLYNQPNAGLTLINDGFVQYTVTVIPHTTRDSMAPEVDFHCSWCAQIPQIGGGGPVWGPLQNAVITSRPDDAVAVPGAWASTGNGLRLPGSPLRVTSVAVGALPMGLAAGAPGGAQHGLVQANGTVNARVVGWQF